MSVCVCVGGCKVQQLILTGWSVCVCARVCAHRARLSQVEQSFQRLHFNMYNLVYIFQIFCRWWVMVQGKVGDPIRDQIREFRRFLHRIFSWPTVTFKWHPQVKRFEMRGPGRRLYPSMLTRWPSHVHLYSIASYCPLSKSATELAFCRHITCACRFKMCVFCFHHFLQTIVMGFWWLWDFF